MRRRKLGVVSGGFDPVHVGHIRLFNEARDRSDMLIVLLNSDEWLERKKGRPFMLFPERKEILENLCPVDLVLSVDDSDGTVVRGIAALHHIWGDSDLCFFNGGDRTAINTPEIQFCQTHGIEMKWAVGGVKAQSSSELLKRWTSERS